MPINFGIAGVEHGDVHTSDWTHLAGDTPPVVTVSVKAVGPLSLPGLSVVKYDGTTIAPAQLGDTPYGITTAPVELADGETTTLAVYIQGHFFMDALNFDPSFATDDDKLAAFNGAPTPTVIVLSKRPASATI